jgi:hypothetical protein
VIEKAKTLVLLPEQIPSSLCWHHQAVMATIYLGRVVNSEMKPVV